MRLLIIFILMLSNSFASDASEIKNLVINKELKNYSGHCRFAFPGQQNQDRPLRDHALIEGGIYRMGYKGKAHIHGFRSLADTILKESNQWNPDAIERQLGPHGTKSC